MSQDPEQRPEQIAKFKIPGVWPVYVGEDDIGDNECAVYKLDLGDVVLYGVANGQTPEAFLRSVTLVPNPRLPRVDDPEPEEQEEAES